MPLTQKHGLQINKVERGTHRQKEGLEMVVTGLKGPGIKLGVFSSTPPSAWMPGIWIQKSVMQSQDNPFCTWLIFTEWGLSNNGTILQTTLCLTHWGQVTYIRVGKLTIIGSDNSLSPGRCQAILWTNAGILLIGPLGTNFNEIFWSEFKHINLKKMPLKMSSA